MISKFQVGLNSLLRQGFLEPDFYGDLVYKLKKIIGSYNFSAQFIKIISHYKKIGYNINVLQQTAFLVVNPITVGNFGIVSSKIYDKRDDFNFEIVNFPFLDGDVPRSPSMVYVFLSLFVLLECVLMLMTSTTETYF